MKHLDHALRVYVPDFLCRLELVSKHLHRLSSIFVVEFVQNRREFFSTRLISFPVRPHARAREFFRSVLCLGKQFPQDLAHLAVLCDRKALHEPEKLGLDPLTQWLLLLRLRFPCCRHSFFSFRLVEI
jgi:hypothetical protein